MTIALVYDPRYHTFESWASLMCEAYAGQQLQIPGPDVDFKSWGAGFKSWGTGFKSWGAKFKPMGAWFKSMCPWFKSPGCGGRIAGLGILTIPGSSSSLKMKICSQTLNVIGELTSPCGLPVPKGKLGDSLPPSRMTHA